MQGHTNLEEAQSFAAPTKDLPVVQTHGPFSSLALRLAYPQRCLYSELYHMQM